MIYVDDSSMGLPGDKLQSDAEGIESLPDEILIKIFCKLIFENLRNVIMVNKKWHGLAPVIWREKCVEYCQKNDRDIGYLTRLVERTYSNNWKEFYRELIKNMEYVCISKERYEELISDMGYEASGYQGILDQIGVFDLIVDQMYAANRYWLLKNNNEVDILGYIFIISEDNEFKSAIIDILCVLVQLTLNEEVRQKVFSFMYGVFRNADNDELLKEVMIGHLRDCILSTSRKNEWEWVRQQAFSFLRWSFQKADSDYLKSIIAVTFRDISGKARNIELGNRAWLVFEELAKTMTTPTPVWLKKAEEWLQSFQKANGIPEQQRQDAGRSNTFKDKIARWWKRKTNALRDTRLVPFLLNYHVFNVAQETVKNTLYVQFGLSMADHVRFVIDTIEETARNFDWLVEYKGYVREEEKTDEAHIWTEVIKGRVIFCITIKMIWILAKECMVMPAEKFTTLFAEIMKHEKLRRNGFSHSEATGQAMSILQKFLIKLPELEKKQITIVH